MSFIGLFARDDFLLNSFLKYFNFIIKICVFDLFYGSIFGNIVCGS
jgi:hypothetical protein